MHEQARDFDMSDPLERAVAEAIEDEGLVLWSRDDPSATHRERHIVAVVAGHDGPEIACARAWEGTLGSIFCRLDMRAPVETACRRHLPASSGDGLGAARLVPHLPDDTALRQAAGENVRVLWQSGNGKSTSYLLRISNPDTPKEIGIATADLQDGRWMAALHCSIPLESFHAWAAAEFGPGIPGPK